MYALNRDGRIDTDTQIKKGNDEIGIPLVLGLSDFSKKSSVSVFPNPVSDELIVRDIDVISGTISSMYGKEAQIFTTNYVDVSSLEKGMYILKVQSKTGETISTKFVKN